MTNGLLPVTITDRRENLRTGRNEIWAATGPGWQFVRTEEPGTPWWAIEDATGRVATFASLRQAREAAGGNLAEVLADNERRASQRAQAARAGG